MSNMGAHVLQQCAGGWSGLQTPDVLLHKGFDPGAEEPVILYRKGLTNQRAALASRPATISKRRKDEVTRLKSCKVGLLFLSFVFSSSHLLNPSHHFTDALNENIVSSS